MARWRHLILCDCERFVLQLACGLLDIRIVLQPKIGFAFARFFCTKAAKAKQQSLFFPQTQHEHRC
jgi:hypothetical protein